MQFGETSGLGMRSALYRLVHPAGALERDGYAVAGAGVRPATYAIDEAAAVTTAETARGRRIDLEELARLPSFYLPTIAWAGDWVAFYWDRTGRMELYVLDLRTPAVRQVSHGEVPRAVRTGFVWDRADRAIVFGKDKLGNEQHDLYRENQGPIDSSGSGSGPT